jgi:iron complex outermembrane receptor protein
MRKLSRTSEERKNAAYIVVFSVLFFHVMLMGALTAFAENSEQMDEVIIEAEQEREAEAEVEDESAFITIIESEEIDETFTTIADVLDKTVGLTVSRLGGAGAFSTASIRGSSAEQVAIFIDGVPLNSGKSGAVNLANIPIRGVERIEVYRGTVPLRFRTSATGGAINIVLKEIEDTFFHQFSGSYGSFDSYEASGASTGTFNKVGYMVAGTFTGTDGDFEFLDDNATPLNPDDDEFVERQNNGFNMTSLNAKIAFNLTPTFTMEFSDTYLDKHEGVPGKGSFQSESATLDTLRNIFYLSLEKREFLFDSVDAEALGYIRYEKTNFKDTEGEIGIGYQDNTNDTLAWGVDGYLRSYLGLHQILSFILSFQNEQFDSFDSLAAVPSGDTQSRSTVQAGVEDVIYLFSDRLVLTPQALYTYVDNRFGGVLPFFGGSTITVQQADDDGFWSLQGGAKLLITDSFSLKGNVGNYYRYPNFSELFGDRGGIIGNPELLPESSLNWDMGFLFDKRGFTFARLPVDRAFFEAVVFSSNYKNLILLEQTSQFTFKAQNISSALIYGAELSWGVALARYVNMVGNYTYQYTRNTSEIPFLRDNSLQLRPAHGLFNRLEVFNRLVKIFWEYNYLGDNYLDQANFFLVESRSIHNLGFSLYPIKHTTVTFEIRNLGNEQIADVRGYPLPGISFVGTVLLEF